jgi:molecular chaperone DnaK
MKDITIGIDFGTTNTVISYYKKNPTVLKDSIKDYIPTKIYFGENIYCGNNIPINVDEKNKNLLSNFKIKVGSNFEFNYNNKIIKEKEVLVLFFNHLKKILVKSFPDTNFNVVLTVPSNFNDNQRSILINVAKFVGFNILRIINEPTAAAFAYGLNKEIEEEKIMVFDIGGGTMDISILEIDDNFFETIDSVGVNDLGGNNFTDAIYNDCLKQFKSERNNEDLLISQNKLVQLWYNCNRAKEKLSWVDSCQIKINDFCKLNKKSESLIYNLDKAKFKNISKDILDRIRRKLSTLKELYKINKLILVGGSSKLDIINELLFEEFKIKPLVHSQLQHVVSLGACYYAALIQKELKNDDIILVDNLPLSLGIETAEGSFSVIIPKNTPLPATRSQKYTIDTPGEEEVVVKVYQGERSIAKKNYLIGQFLFNKISKIGNPVINITFKVDINGLINVTIEDKHSGSNKDILIKNDQINMDDNLGDILKEAEENKDIDEKDLIY